jgi:hypothetical protein
MSMATQWFVIYGFIITEDKPRTEDFVGVTAELSLLPTDQDLRNALALQDSAGLEGIDYCITGFTPITVDHAARFFAMRQVARDDMK